MSLLVVSEFSYGRTYVRPRRVYVFVSSLALSFLLFSFSPKITRPSSWLQTFGTFSFEHSYRILLDRVVTVPTARLPAYTPSIDRHFCHHAFLDRCSGAHYTSPDRCSSDGDSRYENGSQPRYLLSSGVFWRPHASRTYFTPPLRRRGD